jgi:carboxymethylenebutenolidase
MSTEVTGRDVEWPHAGATLRGHLASPDGDDPRPGLVLIPDVRGLGDHFRDVARRFALEGLRTLVLDIYSREGAPVLTDMSGVQRWIRQLPDRRVLGDVRSARDWLAALPGTASRVGVTGFCLGGQYTLMAACTVPGFSAAVSCYGMLRYAETDDVKPESPLAMAPRLACPWLGLYGDDDALIPVTDVEELRGILEASRTTFEIVRYPGAGHAFFNDTRPETYRAEPAQDGFRRATAFLRTHLASRA